MNSKLQSYFQQDEPHLGNQYLEDFALTSYLKRVLPKSILNEIESDLVRFGERCSSGGDILKYGRETDLNPPRLIHYNAFGRRVDEIIVSPGWNRLLKIWAEEGLINIGYARKQNEYSRLYQFVKCYLYGPSGFISDCPMAMTDGAARLIELNINTIKNQEVKKKVQEAYKRLISRDINECWTSGQWMTERTGGSDVGGSETIAIPNDDDTYSIYGYKFFTSSTTSDVTFLLARITDKDGKRIEGSRGLSVFYMEMRKPNGELNNIIIHKLKNKLGTKSVPTAELELCGSKAYLVGEVNSGIKVISSILNITRIHNAVTMVGNMRRGVAIARDYASRRKAFGRYLKDHPLHVQTLFEMECELRGALQITLDACLLLGKIECQTATEDENVVFRLLTPMVKLYTAKQAIAVTSEAIESLGGTGYMEDSDMPRLLRDCQVGSIWEGTTNILSLDLWRPILKENGMNVMNKYIKQRIDSLGRLSNELSEFVKVIFESLDKISSFVKDYGTNKIIAEINSRKFAYSLSRIYISVLLLEHVCWVMNNQSKEFNINDEITVLKYWMTQKPLVEKFTLNMEEIKSVQSIGLDIDPKTKQLRGSGDRDLNNNLRSKY